MEYWDIYNADRIKTGKIIERGEYLNDDEYHIVVNAWILRKDGKYLISQRNEKKTHPLMWEVTGGSILKGETSLEGVLREVKEELNIDLKKEEAKLIGSKKRYYKGCPDILDVYLFLVDDSNFNIKIQEEEVKDYKWASCEEIKQLKEQGQFETTAFFDTFIK